jgi:hypothetical protein
MDYGIICKPLEKWVKLYGKKLIGAKTHMATVSEDWVDGAIIVSVRLDTNNAEFKSRSGRTGWADSATMVGIYEESYDKLPKIDFIRTQVKEKLKVEI